MMIGDWLLFSEFWATDASTLYDSYVDRLSLVDRNRAIVGGLLGPVGAMLIIKSFISLFYQMNEKPRAFAVATVICFVVMMICNGFYHASFLFYNPELMNWLNSATAEGFNQGELYKAIYDLGTFAYNIGKVGFLFFAVWLVVKSNLRRSSIVLLLIPTVLFFVQYLVVHIPAPVGGVIAGVYSNLVLFLFFLLLVIAYPANHSTKS